MKVDLYIDHINSHERIAERQLKTAVNNWCKKNKHRTADECNYRGMLWTTYCHADFAQRHEGLNASIFIPGESTVVFNLHEGKESNNHGQD